MSNDEKKQLLAAFSFLREEHHDSSTAPLTVSKRPLRQPFESVSVAEVGPPASAPASPRPRCWQQRWTASLWTPRSSSTGTPTGDHHRMGCRRRWVIRRLDSPTWRMRSKALSRTQVTIGPVIRRFLPRLLVQTSLRWDLQRSRPDGGAGQKDRRSSCRCRATKAVGLFQRASAGGVQGTEIIRQHSRQTDVSLYSEGAFTDLAATRTCRHRLKTQAFR